VIDLNTLPEHRRSNGYDGYVYVLEFSTGIVKIGKTRNPRARIATHVEDAKKFGATVDQLWLSEWHENYSDNERALLPLAKPRTVSPGQRWVRAYHVIELDDRSDPIGLTDGYRLPLDFMKMLDSNDWIYLGKV